MALGAAVTLGVGQLVRVGRFASPVAGVQFSLMADCVVLGLLVPVLALQRWAWGHLPLLAAVLAVGGAMVAATGAVVLVTIGMAAIHPSFYAPYGGDRLVQSSYYLIVFLGWSVSAAWLRARQAASDQLARALEAEKAALNADMTLLRMQLDSHFLFNALNTIAVEIQDSPRQALLLVRELSHYLRFSAETAGQRLVPISAEIAALQSFLRVQTLRFGSQLVFKVSHTGSTRNRLVPPFLVQPLVENATKHGIPGDDGVMTVEVTIRMAGDGVHVCVTNSGELAPGNGARAGTGLPALARRLEVHYPGRHRFALSRHGNHVHADLHLDGPPC